MEPVSALGLAGSLIQILDFSFKTVATVRQIKKSHHGASKAMARLEERSEKLQHLCDELDTSPHGTTQTEIDKSIASLSLKCKAQAQELHDFLLGLHSSRNGNFMSALFAFSKTTWNESRLTELENNLQQCRDELHLHLSAALYNQTKNNAEIHSSLNSVQTKAGIQEIEGSKNLEESISELLMQTEQISASLDVNPGLFEESISRLRIRRRRELLLRSLNASVSRRRQEMIVTSHEGTHEWIFDDYHEQENVMFNTWLESGKGIFWITGKPGCGKSTLMKFLSQHHRIVTGLQLWNGGHSPVTSHFFFWVGVGIENSRQCWC